MRRIAGLGGLARHQQLSARRQSQIGRKAGRASGKARMLKIRPERRSEIARNAARARWSRRSQPVEGLAPGRERP